LQSENKEIYKHCASDAVDCIFSVVPGVDVLIFASHRQSKEADGLRWESEKKKKKKKKKGIKIYHI
jgi:hypothetical protein